MKNLFLLLPILLLFTACDKENTNPQGNEGPYLNVKFKFDPTQERLGPLGQSSTIPNGHAAQTPSFNGMSAHFIELVQTQWTPYRSGAEVYLGAETNAGSSTAIDFDKAVVADEGVVWHQVPLKNLAAATYNNIRVSVSFQNYEVKYNLNNVPFVGDLNNQNGIIASFLGYNTYITEVSPKNRSKTVNDDKRQGYWAFETDFTGQLEQYNLIVDGEAPSGATTVVNNLNSDGIPAGSCIVGGDLVEPLVITGDETEDITIVLSFSNNQSFEWIDNDGNGEWDLDSNGTNSEPVVDMGLRGLKVLIE